MPKIVEFKKIYRILDANINRCKEGLRVCEEVARFILDDKSLTGDFKRVRHRIDSLIENSRGNPRLLEQRDSLKDVGLKVKNKAEFTRRDLTDVFYANIQRAKESVRVLEEFSKINDSKAAMGLRKIRYNIYELERKTVKKLGQVVRGK
ncbi:MAG: thiamine-phosphate pyrophosphorylase [Candidatus Omnitrophota bacterium]